MHDHDSSLLKLQIRGTWMYRMTMVVLIFEIEPVPKIFESHHWAGASSPQPFRPPIFSPLDLTCKSMQGGVKKRLYVIIPGWLSLFY